MKLNSQLTQYLRTKLEKKSNKNTTKNNLSQLELTYQTQVTRSRWLYRKQNEKNCKVQFLTNLILRDEIEDKYVQLKSQKKLSQLSQLTKLVTGVW
jgi:hypothetical protein